MNDSYWQTQLSIGDCFEWKECEQWVPAQVVRVTLLLGSILYTCCSFRTHTKFLIYVTAEENTRMKQCSHSFRFLF